MDGVPVIPGYVIEALIGTGGNGTVYRALRERSDVAVAIKICHFNLRSRRTSERAYRELSLLRGLRITALPRVYDYGEVDGSFYLVTELIDGENLESWHASRSLDLRSTVELLVRVARAVQSVHEQGIIHRDIKPANIMIDHRGEPVLIDLGIATLISSGSSHETLTMEGQPIGSPAFMSPEQARGDRRAVSVRSDVYSLGATAFRLLTGSTPHEHTDSIHESIRRVAQDPSRRARQLAPEIPRALDAILDKALSHDPSSRYASADGFANDLERWLQGEPTVAWSDSPMDRLTRMVQRRALRVVILSVVGMLISAAMVAAILLRPKPLPAMLILAEDGRSAHVEDFDGNVIRRWTGNGESFLLDGGYVPRVVPFDDRGAVILAFETEDVPSPLKHLAGKLCVYDVNDVEGEPTWIADTASNGDSIVMPDPISNTRDLPFRIRDFSIADVFDDSAHPGPELITIHQVGLMSQTCIRIYRLNGEVVYEAWYDGDLRDATWMPQSRILYFVGCNSEGSLADRIEEKVQCTAHPQIVLGIRPEPGVFHDEKWLGSVDGPRRVKAAFHRAVGPFSAYDEFFARDDLDPKKRTWKLHIADEEFLRVTRDQIRIIAEQVDSYASFSFILNPDGTMSDRLPSSTFEQELHGQSYLDVRWEPVPPAMVRRDSQD